MAQFCNVVDIPKNKFKKYAHGEQNKRRTITNGVGNRPLYSRCDRKFVADTIALHYRSNNGLTPAAVIDRLQDINRGVTRKQASNHLHRKLKKNHNDVVKKHIVVGQVTTTNLNTITVVQQFRWHSTINTAL